MKRFFAALALWLIPFAAAAQAVTSSPAPWLQIGNAVSVSASTSSGSTAVALGSIGSPIPAVEAVYNNSTGVDAYCAIGSSSVTASASLPTASTVIPFGKTTLLPYPKSEAQQYIACVTGSSSTTLVVSGGNGSPTAGGGGGGGGGTGTPGTPTGSLQTNAGSGNFGGISETDGSVAYGTGGAWGKLALGTGVATWLGAPSGANLASALTSALPISAGGTGTASPALVAGTNVTITGSWPDQTINASAGSSTGFGVDSGTGVVTITASCTMGAPTGECGGTANNHAIRQVDLNLAGATTVTLDAIANLNTGACVRFHDAAGTVSGTNTLTLTANSADAINGGSSGGSTSAFTTAGLGVFACVSATHNWNIGPGSIAASTAPSNQFANGVTQNGLTYAQPSIANLSGWGTNVEGAAATTLSAAGGLTSTIASGTAALGTSAISSATCASAVTVSATNVATTDTVLASFNGDPTAVTGYIPATAGMLTIIGYPTSGNVNFKVCNNTSSSVTPGAITLNWRVLR